LDQSSRYDLAGESRQDETLPAWARLREHRVLAPLIELERWFAWYVGTVVDDKTGEAKVDAKGKPKLSKRPWRAKLSDPEPSLTRDDPIDRGVDGEPGGWKSYDDAVADALRHRGSLAGIGFALVGTDYVVLDFDKCRDPEQTAIMHGLTGGVFNTVRKLGSYVEASVSGKGVHVIGIASADTPSLHRRVRHEGCTHLEIFHRLAPGSSRFITFSGWAIDALCSPELGNLSAAAETFIWKAGLGPEPKQGMPKLAFEPRPRGGAGGDPETLESLITGFDFSRIEDSAAELVATLRRNDWAASEHRNAAAFWVACSLREANASPTAARDMIVASSLFRHFLKSRGPTAAVKAVEQLVTRAFAQTVPFLTAEEEAAAVTPEAEEEALALLRARANGAADPEPGKPDVAPDDPKPGAKPKRAPAAEKPPAEEPTVTKRVIRPPSAGAEPPSSEEPTPQEPPEEPPEELSSLIRNGGLAADGKPPKNRSKSFFYVVAKLRERGFDAARITKLLKRYPNGIGRCFRQRLGAEVTRVLAKLTGPIGLDKHDLTVDDFYAFPPKNAFIFAPAGEFWPRDAVDLRTKFVFIGKDDKGEDVLMPASVWLDRKKTVEQITWAPGEPQAIAHRLISEGGWSKQQGCHVFNLYRPPQRKAGDRRKASPWLRHLIHTYGKEQARHIIGFLAHRIQRPQEKINHGLVLAGEQGIGKDTLLEPVKYGVGPWNFKDITPKPLLGRFNPFVKAVVLRISEARDLGEVSRYDFYEHTKVYLAAPPDVLMCDEKNIREHPIVNVCGVIFTTNHKEGGIYLPPDDRRHYVAWSELKKENFTKSYWNWLWGWYKRGGIWNVVAYLEAYDLAKFDPKAPPPQTEAWRAIVDSSKAPEEAELADALDLMNNPPVVTLKDILKEKIKPAIADFLEDRKNRRIIPHRMKACGYVPVRNDVPKDGLWKIGGARQVIYAKEELTKFQQLSEIKRRYHV
jgi:hypothetical protein